MNTVQRTLAALAVSLAGSFALGATASVHAAGPAGTGAGDPVLQSGGPDISLLNGPTGSVCNLSLHAAPAVNDVPTFTPAQCLSDGIEFGSDVGWPADGGTLDFTVESRDGSQVLYKQMGVYITPSLAPGGSGGWSVNSFLTLQPGLYKVLIDTQGLEYEYDFAVADGASATARVGRPAHVAVTSSGQPLIAATADVASGLGTLAVGAYPVNPATDLPGSDAGTRYFDVRLVPRDSSSQFAALQVTVSNVTDTEQTPYWYDKGAGLWEPMTGASPTYDATNHTLTLTFTPTSLPALDAFSGTYIAVGPAAGTPPGPGGGGTATPELSSGELFATGIVPLGLVLLFRRRRGRSRGNRRAHVA